MLRSALFSLYFLLLTVFGTTLAHATSYTIDIFAHVPGCGDTLIQSGEECDGVTLGGATCETIGFDEGTLSCSSACTFITTSCTFDNTNSGGTRVPSTQTPLPDTNVVVFGFGTVGATVSLLKDGQRVGTVPVREDGSFQITISGLGTGTYRFQLVSEKIGSDPVRSEVIVLRVLRESTTKVGPVSLPPFSPIVPESTPIECLLIGDINQDCRVNSVDFFVTRFLYVRDMVLGRFDFDNDGELTIVDFSIMAFYWTG
jgi:hypothetical protein